jgi:hypothetical protein
MKPKLSVIALAGALFILAGCSTPHPGPTAWEYRVVRGVTHTSDVEDRLNKLGAEGYTIVSSQTLPEQDNRQAITIVILQKGKR